MKRTILIASVDFPPHTDGVSTLSGELARNLVALGHDVCCVGPKGRGDRACDAANGWRAMRFHGYALGYVRFFPFLLVFVLALIRFRPRLVFAMNIAYGGVLASAFRTLFGYRYCLWGYGYEFEKVRNPLFRRWYRGLYNRAARVFAISRFVRGRLVRFGVMPERMRLIFPGTDPDRFFPQPVSAGQLAAAGFARLLNHRVILSVGRLVERKGVDRMIAALPAVLEAAPGALYLVVGQGPARPYLESLAAVHGVSERVFFAGRVAEANLLLLYNACDVFAMPSREIVGRGDVEGFGIVYLEANACGKPVIGGRSGGVEDAVLDGVTGLLVDPEDSRAVGQAAVRLLTEAGLARKLGQQGLRRVREELNWRIFARRTMEELA